MKKIVLGKSDAWSFIPVNQQTSVLYCRLSDFCTHSLVSQLMLKKTDLV